MKLVQCLTSYTKINSKWIKKLNVRFETMKLIEENICGKLLDISLSDDFFFFGFDTKSNESKNKVGLHQTKKFLMANDTINNIKRQSSEWEKIFANPYV